MMTQHTFFFKVVSLNTNNFTRFQGSVLSYDDEIQVTQNITQSHTK